MKIKIVLICLLVSVCYAHADEQEKHEFTIGGNIGASSFRNNLSEGSQKYGLGGGAVINYHYFFNDEFGVSTGLELSYHQGKTIIKGLSDYYTTNDGIDDFEFRSIINNYEELQNVLYVNIPLLLDFQYPLLHDDHLNYLLIGAKIGLPIRSLYSSTGADFKTSAYYPAYDLLLENPKSQGFGSFHTGRQKDKLDFNMAYTFTAETGMKFEIGEYTSLYAGVYLDYGINDISKKKGNTHFLKYNNENPANYQFNSMLNANYTQGGTTNNISKHFSPVALGIRVRIAFRMED